MKLRNPFKRKPVQASRWCSKCGYQHWIGRKGSEPFEIRWRSKSDRLAFECPQCKHVTLEPTYEARVKIARQINESGVSSDEESEATDAKGD